MPRERGAARRARTTYVARAYEADDRAIAWGMKLLAVSWEMPPMYGPRATQVSRTLGALVPLGWQPTVVCLDPRRGGPNWRDGVDLAPPPGVELIRVPSAEEWMVVRAARKLVPALRGTPDPQCVWIPRATAAAEAAAK